MHRGRSWAYRSGLPGRFAVDIIAVTCRPRQEKCGARKHGQWQRKFPARMDQDSEANDGKHGRRKKRATCGGKQVAGGKAWGMGSWREYDGEKVRPRRSGGRSSADAPFSVNDWSRHFIEQSSCQSNHCTGRFVATTGPVADLLRKTRRPAPTVTRHSCNISQAACKIDAKRP